MTCIVAIAEKGKVYMGADSAGVAGYSLNIRKDPKLFNIDDKFLIGYTSSFRMGQLLGYSFTPPEHDKHISVDKYMNTTFIDEVRKLFKDGGYTEFVNQKEQGGEFLVGYQGRIYKISCDFQVGESVFNFDTTGCGGSIASGSLYSTMNTKLTPQKRLELALHAAETFSSGVRSPFIFDSVKK